MTLTAVYTPYWALTVSCYVAVTWGGCSPWFSHLNQLPAKARELQEAHLLSLHIALTATEVQGLPTCLSSNIKICPFHVHSQAAPVGLS